MRTSHSKGRLVVVSGPGGAGKTAVVGRILADPRFERAPTATTRPPRGAEKDGVDYRFLSKAEFERHIAAGGFLEHVIVCGNLYGTPVEGPEAIRAAGKHCVLVIDVQGAAALRSKGIEALYVFLAPPRLTELERRIREQRQDPDAAVAARLVEAKAETARRAEFDMVVVNDDIAAAAAKIAAAALAPQAPQAP